MGIGMKDDEKSSFWAAFLDNVFANVFAHQTACLVVNSSAWKTEFPCASLVFQQ